MNLTWLKSSFKQSFILSCMLLATISVGFTSTSAYFLDTSRLELQVSSQTQTAGGVIKVTSNSTRTLRLRVLPKLWTLNPQGVLQYTDTPNPDFNLLDHIEVNPREFDLQPGKSRLVRFVVKVPEEQQNVEYPFQLYFEPVSLLESKNASESTGVNNMLDVIPVFTTTVYVYKGHPMPDVKVNQFTCGYDPKQSLLDVNLILKNQGAKHARLFGNLLIFPDKNTTSHKPIDVLHMQNSTLIIAFPGAERMVQNKLSLNTKLTPGAHEVELQLVDERNEQAAVQSTCQFTVP